MSIDEQANSPWGRARLLAIALSLAITAIFILAATYIVDWHAFMASYRKITPAQIMLIGALAFIPTLLRIVRLCIAIGQPLQWVFFRAVTMQGAAIATLPAKIGEAVLPLALVRRANYPVAEAVGVLLLLRLYDLLTIILIGTIGLTALAGNLGVTAWRPLLLMGAAATLGVMVFFPAAAGLFSAQIRKYLHPEGKIMHLLEQLSLSSRHLQGKQLAGLILTSGLIWAFLSLVFYLAGVYFEATPGVMASALAGVAGAFAFALPVNGLANLGPFEAAWAGVMLPLGVLPESAIAAALLSHAIMILTNLTLAGAGVLQWALSGTRGPLI